VVDIVGYMTDVLAQTLVVREYEARSDVGQGKMTAIGLSNVVVEPSWTMSGWTISIFLFTWLNRLSAALGYPLAYTPYRGQDRLSAVIVELQTMVMCCASTRELLVEAVLHGELVDDHAGDALDHASLAVHLEALAATRVFTILRRCTGSRRL